jgi:hypothetical protein
MGDAFDIQARLAEFKQQAELQTGRFQTNGALQPSPGSSARGHVCVVQCFDSLQLDQKHAVDQHVHEILAYQDVFVAHLRAVLLHSRYAQPITRPGRSFSSLLSACSACIVFLHLR